MSMSMEGELDWAQQSVELWAHIWEPVMKAVRDGASTREIARLATEATIYIEEETEGQFPYATLWSLGPAPS